MSGVGKIADLVRKIERLSAPEFREGMAQTIGEKCMSMIADGFAQKRSPYGAWKSRKRNYPWPIMDKTGDGKRSWRLRVGPGGLKIVSDGADYLEFQFYGTRRGLDHREMFPVEAFGLGAWREPINETATSYVRRLLAR